MSEKRQLEEVLDGAVQTFIANAQRELHTRWDTWPRTFERNHVFEVLGALLARQVTLACQVAASPQMWEPHSGPIFMRAMADVHITVAWILLAPDDRAQKFIHHGLGQAKLEVEHRRAELADGRTPKPGEAELLKARERWIDGQRLMFLTSVNLGAWSGINTRQMAEEAGCLDFYNYVYVPFSGCAHSMWHHVGVFNLQRCSNPLHGLHSVPVLPDFETVGGDPHTLYLAGKYLDKTCRAIDGVFSGPAEPVNAFDNLCYALDDVYRLAQELR
ncbi:MAG: DUF5677 domain-containing protein [Proteobacteria bacterium]|nr:DUF5677 domain-containing protein [Pseudomonadota bacterium]